MTIKKISVTPSEALQRHIDDKSKEIKDKATPGASYFKGSILADLAEAGLRLPQVEASLGSARGELLGVREELAAAQNDLAIARAELARHQDREQRAKSTAKDAQAALAVESRLREELGAARREKEAMAASLEGSQRRYHELTRQVKDLARKCDVAPPPVQGALFPAPPSTIRRG
jgi:chromosome segregation ATPase